MNYFVMSFCTLFFSFYFFKRLQKGHYYKTIFQVVRIYVYGKKEISA